MEGRTEGFQTERRKYFENYKKTTGKRLENTERRPEDFEIAEKSIVEARLEE